MKSICTKILGHYQLLILTASAMLLSACPDPNSSSNSCSLPTYAKDAAAYEITFNGVWSSSTHPTDFPASAHFSGLIGMGHKSTTTLFSSGTKASAGIKNMAETGSKLPLTSEINAKIASGDANVLISGGGINPSPGSASISCVTISKSHDLVSLASMIAPSSDWFIAVKSVDLFENGAWVNTKTENVSVYDAGTDSGPTFTSPNAVENINIHLITTSPLATGGAVSTMGSITFTKKS